jgi:large subunit ribosomal protein L21
MYAIFRSGSKQYRAEVGKLIDVERLPLKANDTLELSEVLLVQHGDNVVIGQPFVKGASVKATVIIEYRANKILVFKYRQRTKYRRVRGHRQYYTRLRIDAIQA